MKRNAQTDVKPITYHVGLYGFAAVISLLASFAYVFAR